jgi:Zn-dependent protease with chaperone function
LAFDELSNSVEGEWFPALSGQPVKARAKFAGGGLHITALDGTLLLVAKPHDIKIAPRIGTVARNISLPDGSEFITGDNAGVDALAFGQDSKHHAVIHRLEEFHPRLFALVLAVLLLGATIYRYAVPALVEIAVWVTPPVVTELMAKGTLETLDSVAFSPTGLSDARQQQIIAGFKQIASVSQSGASRFKLSFRKGGFVGPNAFALPDGTLVITDELMDLAGSDDELILGVLAHEIGHVEKDHSLRQLYRAAGVTGLIFLIGGDIGDGAQDALVQGAGLLTLSYSRDAEAEADRHSVELMLKAGKDPVAIGRFFELIEKEFGDSNETSMFSTHPGTPERRKAANDYAKSLGAKLSGAKLSGAKLGAALTEVK